MATRNLRYYGDPILRKKCREVKVIDDKIRQILEDMADTLRETENGVAIAANQVGILKRLVVIRYEGSFLKLVNPVITDQSGAQECNEACLSFPGRCVKTLRPQSAAIKAQNECGEEITLTGQGWLAQCFCHELEHLDGEIFLDKAIGDAVPRAV